MRFAHFFVDRPIFASVLSIVLLIVGSIAYFQLPVAQYPEIAPPTIVVRASYPGADAETVANTVATPLEQEINGVENMLYMSSYATADGSMALTITFKLGTDLDQAQVLVQNRVSIAEPRLPEEVRRIGVTTTKSSPDLMMVVHLLSPNDRYDQLYVSNYARTRIRDILVRLDGVGDVLLFGEREYALRIWLDPQKLSAYGMTAGDVVSALREQNVQVSGGSIGGPPMSSDSAFQYTVTTDGRFSDARQFRYVIVKATEEGRLVQLQDVARIELGAREYVTNSYLNGSPAVALGIFSRPGSNALAAADAIQATMTELSRDFPEGLEYRIIYNPTEFISESIDEVYKTIAEAALLVALVVIVFLQSWRTAIIPIVAIPVSLVGTFALLYAFGFSLNMLTLFGLVLAIGIVVDDAIVVVENVERNLARGMTPREAAHVTMDEVGAAVIAISLVLTAVFVPTAFIPGIAGQFYLQFAVTIAVATVISAVNSLTLSPALAAILLRPHENHEHESRNPLTRLGRGFANGFNRGFDRMADGYAWTVRHLVRTRIALAGALLVFVALLGATWYMAQVVPRGFIPTMDQGYAIVVIQLPDGASLERTDKVVRRASEMIREVPGVKDAVAFAGFNGATFTNASNSGVIFTPFDSFEERLEQKQSAEQIIGQIFGAMQGIQEAFIIAVPPPSVRGIGNSGGFKMQIMDRQSADMRRALGLAYQMMGAAQPDGGADRRLHHIHGLEPAILPGDRPRQGAGPERPDPQYLRDALDQSGDVLRQRFQRLRPRLSGPRPGRPAIPAGAGGHTRAQGTLRLGRARAARNARRNPRYERSGARPALQHVCLGPRSGQSCAGRLDGAAPSTRWKRLQVRSCRRARPSNGRNSLCRSARPATLRSSSSLFRWSSSSWRSRRNMKAGCCRWPSS
jgi:HAE1 family hydrophobic/amphiphilic exporter-1